MDYVISFLVGGAICGICQIFLDKTKWMPGRIMTGLVVIGCVLGMFGIYEPFARWAGCGATVPLLGFGNTLVKGVKEGIADKGFLGIFTGGFTAGAAGICAALVFSYIASWIFKPKMR
jgi:stage V sporulation protein AE